MWHPVQSSNLLELAHEGETLKVRFRNGREYHYFGVGEDVLKEILGAASAGRAFNMLIKSAPEAYPFKRIEQP